MAAPALNPTSTVSLIKFIMLLSLSRYAITLITANTSADKEARSTQRCTSPPAIPASDTPINIEIADVGPMASCLPVPKKA
jgi:hypothetical protein